MHIISTKSGVKGKEKWIDGTKTRSATPVCLQIFFLFLAKTSWTWHQRRKFGVILVSQMSTFLIVRILQPATNQSKTIQLQMYWCKYCICFCKFTQMDFNGFASIIFVLSTGGSWWWLLVGWLGRGLTWQDQSEYILFFFLWRRMNGGYYPEWSEEKHC